MASGKVEKPEKPEREFFPPGQILRLYPDYVAFVTADRGEAFVNPSMVVAVMAMETPEGEPPACNLLMNGGHAITVAVDAAAAAEMLEGESD
jgi:hypothetical protein